MKKLKHVLVLFICLISIYGSNINAQSIQVINPSNVSASALEIKDFLGSRLNISSTKIEDFYLEHWEGVDYNSNAAYPEAYIIDNNNTTISFEWAPMPVTGPELVLVGYLNLSDEVYSLTNNTVQTTIDIDLPNDLYLFTFQGTDGDGARGDLFSIIIDKPILGISEKDCTCPQRKEVWRSKIQNKKGGPASESYAWTPTSAEERYYCEIDFEHWPTASFTSSIEFDGNTPQRVGMIGPCMENIRPHNSFTFLQAFNGENEDQVLGHLFFVTNPDTESPLPEFTYFASANFQYPELADATIRLYKCQNKPGRRRVNSSTQTQGIEEYHDRTTKLSLKELSGSLNLQKSIQYTLPETGNISIILYDSYGRVVQQIKNRIYAEAGTHQVEMNLSNQASGLYYCVLKTEKETVNLKLIVL